MLFKPEHVEPILCGEKTQTRRVWKKRRARVGAVHKAKLKMLSRDYFARLRITGVRQERLGDISEADARAEGGYTIESYRQEWIKINGTWDPDQLVYVIDFVKEWPAAMKNYERGGRVNMLNCIKGGHRDA